MRVLMVTPSYYPIKGGAETLIKDLTVQLNRFGVHTDIMAFNMNRKWKPFWHAKTELTGGICIYRVPGLNYFPFSHSDRITMGINLIPGRYRDYFNDYDVIHFHIGDLTFPFFSLNRREPRIAHFHGPLKFYKRYFLSRLILKNMADIYVAISQNMFKEFLELGVRSKQIKYLPNAVDTNFFKPFGDKTENLILFVGRITFGKGLHVLLDALHNIRTKIHLVIIGSPDWDVEYFQEINNRIDFEKKTGYHEITYLGEQEKDVIVRWYQKASIFVLPSFREASPVTVLEALSCGTAVVATNVGGISEVVINGKNGILVSTNNSKELALTIQSLLDDEVTRNSFGLEGRKTVVQNFSFDAMIKNLCQIYSQLS